MARILPYEAGDDAGFTLTELLVVLAIIGLLLAATPVLMRAAIPGARSETAARELASDLRAVRAAAIARGATARIVFETWRQDYVSEPWHRVRRLPPGVRFGFPGPGDAGADRSIVFFSDGSSSGGRVLIGAGRWQHRVSTDWLTGRVTVDE